MEDGQPIAMVMPDQDGLGVPVMPNMVSLIAGAPHPEEGQKLIDYLLSADVERQARPIGGGADSPASRRAGSRNTSSRSTRSSR